MTLPPACWLCDSATDVAGAPICHSCRQLVDDNFRQTFCPRCSATTGPFAGRQGTCAACRTIITPLERVVRLGSHEEHAAELVRAYKYGGQQQLEAWFAGLLAQRLLAEKWWPAVDALTPVPTCWSRRLRGGKHVATPLARAVSRRCGTPCLSLLRRIRGGPSQIGLSQQQRMQNVRNKFRMQRGVSLQKATVCLIDDVSTTGATLFECARMLKRGGASTVYAAFLCKSSSISVAT